MTTPSQEIISSSFTTKRINCTTFVVQENDAFNEHPLIYVKLHPEAPVLVLSDTGCDEPSEGKKNGLLHTLPLNLPTYCCADSDYMYKARFTQLRDYLENCPVACNKNTPLNLHGSRQYYIIITHCHYDHLGSSFPQHPTPSLLFSHSLTHLRRHNSIPLKWQHNHRNHSLLLRPRLSRILPRIPRSLQPCSETRSEEFPSHVLGICIYKIDISLTTP